MTFCSSCGTEVPDDAQFCPKCGTSLERSSFPGMDPHIMKHAMKDEYRAQKHAFKEARRAAKWGGWMGSPEWALIDALFGGLIVILLVLRGFAAIVIPGRPHEAGSIIGGIVLIIIGAAGVSIFLTGISQYLWIAIIVLGGILVIVAGIASYIFRTR